jgi:2-amino-4-hydroxy-6-hydroxymethyldihydropteridine diphosphokinase
MNTAILLTGSNISPRRDYLKKASEAIALKIGQIFSTSSIYESEAWGFDADTTFMNQVVCVKTTLDAGRILEQIHAIEYNLGRKRNADGTYSSRTIDVDILFFNDEIIKNESLEIPHPRLHERMFTLKPLQEVAAGLIHPVLKKPVEKLLQECTDPIRAEIADKL